MLALTSCQEEGRKGAKDAIRFTASAPSTKTTYGNISGGQQPIYWDEYDLETGKGDIIRIYSDKATHRYHKDENDNPLNWAEYVITNVREDKTQADFENVPGDGTGNGLVWGEVGTYQFYAVCPNPEFLDFDGGKINLYMPNRQAFSVKGNLSDYGYMTAWSKSTTTVYGEGEMQRLDFETAFSAFEISIRSAGDAVQMKEFNLISDSKALAGDYNVEYDSDGVRTMYPTTASDKKITVNLSGKVVPAAEGATKDLIFTVFAIPQTYNDLSVSFTTAENVTRTMKLKTASGSNVSFAPGKKHRIYGLVLPSGELLVSVDTAPWVTGGESTYTTIEDASTIFESYRAYLNGQPLWTDTYIAVAPGFEAIHTDPDDPTSPTTNRPMYSPMFTLTTVSVGVELKLVSDNENVGFVQLVDGVYSEPSTILTIPASSETEQYPYGEPHETSYFVVPMTGATVGDVAHISLIRGDQNTPIAYSHQDVPATTDHTKVLFMVVSPETYQSDTETQVIYPKNPS